jgi:hypothetical protein
MKIYNHAHPGKVQELWHRIIQGAKITDADRSAQNRLAGIQDYDSSAIGELAQVANVLPASGFSVSR